MNLESLTFDQLFVGLSRRKNQDQLVNYMAKNHMDRLDDMVLSLSRSDSTAKNGIKEICKTDPERAIPILMKHCRTTDTALGATIVEFMAEFGEPGMDAALVLIGDNDTTISGRGADIIRAFGSDGVKILRTKLSGENPPKRALAILMELDPEAISFFEDAVKDILSTQDQILSRYAIDAVASAGDFATPILLDMVGSSDPFQQQNATNALIVIGEPIVPELIDELDHPNPMTQQNVMRALREIGLPAVPALREALETNSQLIKQNATSVLSKIQVKSKRGRFQMFRR